MSDSDYVVTSMRYGLNLFYVSLHLFVSPVNVMMVTCGCKGFSSLQKRPNHANGTMSVMSMPAW